MSISLSPLAQDRRTDRIFAIGIAVNLASLLGIVYGTDGPLMAALLASISVLGLVLVLARRHGGTPVCAYGQSLAWAGCAIAMLAAAPHRPVLVLNMVLVMSLLPSYRRWPIVVMLGTLFAITPFALGLAVPASSLALFVAFMTVQSALMAWMARRYDQLSRQIFDVEFLVRAMGAKGPVRLDLDVLRAETTIGQRLMNVQQRVAQTLAQVQQSVTAARDAAGKLQHNGLELTARTQQASSDLDGAAITLSQISVIVKSSADAAMAARQTAQAATALALDGGQIVSQMVEQMKTIDGASSRIFDIIGVIEGIAFQTSMLALNAAVEAARAGEQGRGFGVVAGEVRMLAQRAFNAAREIKSVVENSAQAVSQGNQLAHQAEQTMQNLTGAVARVDETFHSLSADTNEHANGIEVIRDSMNELNTATQHNLQVAEQAQLIADDLAARAASLAVAMAGFRLSPESERHVIDASVPAGPPEHTLPAALSDPGSSAGLARAVLARARTSTAPASQPAAVRAVAALPAGGAVQASNVEFF